MATSKKKPAARKAPPARKTPEKPKSPPAEKPDLAADQFQPRRRFRV